MRAHRKIAATALAGTVLATVLAAGASAQETTVDGTIASSISISTAPSASVAMTLASTGANTATSGIIAVTANEDYKLTVVGDKALMTAYDAINGYGTDTLASALSVVPTLKSGVGVPVTAAVSTTAATIATSVGLTTDEYNLTLSQPTTIADKAGTYRIVLTYTAASTV